MTRPTLLLAFGLVFLVSACGRSEPTPSDVYRTFHESLVGMARGGETGGAARAYELLTKESQERLVRLANTLNDALPASVPRREPSELLRVRRLETGAAIDDIVERSVDDTHAALEVRVGETVQTVSLRRENGAWRVAWFEPLVPAAETTPEEKVGTASEGSR